MTFIISDILLLFQQLEIFVEVKYASHFLKCVNLFANLALVNVLVRSKALK